MKNFIISCHVEPKKGGEIVYLNNFFTKVAKWKFPLVLTYLIDETTQDKIFKIAVKYQKLFPGNISSGIHFHENNLKYLETYKKYFGSYPEISSFGHWKLDREFLARCLSIKTDFSFAAYRQNCQYFFSKPFRQGTFIEIPISCDPKFPINPIYSWYHLVWFLFLIPTSKILNQTLHVYFHSYDLDDKKHPAMIVRQKIFFLCLKFI